MHLNLGRCCNLRRQSRWAGLALLRDINASFLDFGTPGFEIHNVREQFIWIGNGNAAYLRFVVPRVI